MTFEPKRSALETSQLSAEPGVIDFGIGQPQLDLLPHQALSQAAADLLTGEDNASLNYGPARGNGYFRQALARFLTRRYGFPVDRAHLMATGGATQALSMIASTLARPGDTVLVEDPTYFLAPRVFADCGLKVVGVPLGPEGLEPEVLSQAIERHRPRLLYTIPVYGNPSGITMAARHRRPIVEMCAREGVLIVADEVYQMLSYSDTPPPPLAAYISSEAVLSVGSFSKILAPGLRLGWIQAAESLLARLTSLGMFASGGGVNHFTGCLVERLLPQDEEEGRGATPTSFQDRYLDRLQSTYRHRVEVMDDLLRQHLAGRVEYQKPGGGYFFWLRLSDGRDAQALLTRAAQGKVGYRSGALFSPTGGFADHLRLSFAHYDDLALRQGVERLAEVLS